MKLITNARHWKLDAFGVVAITSKDGGEWIRTKLIAIVKDQTVANLLTNQADDIIIVPTSAECSTPEQICKQAAAIHRATRQNRPAVLQ